MVLETVQALRNDTMTCGSYVRTTLQKISSTAAWHTAQQRGLRTFQLFSQPVKPHLKGLLPPRSPPCTNLLWSDSSFDVRKAVLLLEAPADQQSE